MAVKLWLHNSDEEREFLEGVYDDVMNRFLDGAKGVHITVSDVLVVDVETDGVVHAAPRKVGVEFHLKSVDALDGTTAEVLASMLGSLLDENNLSVFEYSISEIRGDAQ